MQTEDEKRRTGEEIKMFLAVNGIDRGRFSELTGLGRSTIDKLVTGIYSDKTLAKVLERTTFRLKTIHARKLLGAYSKANWSGYIARYLLLQPALEQAGAISAALATIDWDDTLPGLMLYEGAGRPRDLEPVGALWIPHERSPLIYMQPVDDIGVRLIVSTMVGEACMRGVSLAVHNVMANAYIPVAAPVVLRRLESGRDIPEAELGLIDLEHPKFRAYSLDLQAVATRQFARLMVWDAA